jgi:hypothetical protein
VLPVPLGFVFSAIVVLSLIGGGRQLDSTGITEFRKRAALRFFYN